tara:strand:+ start:1081 stop:1248 length:168 start_codon:yes stop_codon:yes gene_type:complete
MGVAAAVLGAKKSGTPKPDLDGKRFRKIQGMLDAFGISRVKYERSKLDDLNPFHR